MGSMKSMKQLVFLFSCSAAWLCAAPADDARAWLDALSAEVIATEEIAKELECTPREVRWRS